MSKKSSFSPWELGLLVLLLASRLLWPALLLAEDATPSRAAAERLVVMIDTEFQDRRSEAGAGLILAADGERLYIATARHVVARPNQNSKIAVSVRWKPEASIPGKLKWVDPEWDLAVVEVPLPPELRPGPDTLLFSALRSSELVVDDDLNVIGNPDARHWGECSAWFALKGKEKDAFILEPDCIEGGHSGGPVVDQGWNVVGLIRGKTEDRAIAYPIGDVLARVRTQGLPVTLAVDTADGGRPRFTEAGLGDKFACALSTTGRIYCWGASAYLGIDTERAFEAPVALKVASRFRFQSLAIGSARACALTLEGQVHCWDDKQLRPAALSTKLRFTKLALGAEHACGIATDTKTYCWGKNDKGQLGDGTQEDSQEPRPIKGDLQLSTITAGVGFTCGVTLEGKGHCWGDNKNGIFGSGSRLDSSSPTPIAFGGQFAQVSAGGQLDYTDQGTWKFACGRTADGTVYCWGGGASENWFRDKSKGGSPVPAPIDWDEKFLDIAAGPSQVCGVTTPQTVVCWGHGLESENVEDTKRLSREGSNKWDPAPVRMRGATGFSQVFVGKEAVCALRQRGTLYCWHLSSRSLNLGGFGDNAGSISNFRPSLPVITSRCTDTKVPDTRRLFVSFLETSMYLEATHLEKCQAALPQVIELMQLFEGLRQACRVEEQEAQRWKPWLDEMRPLILSLSSLATHLPSSLPEIEEEAERREEEKHLCNILDQITQWARTEARLWDR